LKYLSYYLFQNKHDIHIINISSLDKSTDTHQYPIYNNRNSIPDYYSQFGVNETQLKKGKHFVLVDTGFRGTIPKTLRDSFAPKYNHQFHIELLISCPDLNDNKDGSASVKYENPPPASRFALMPFDAFLPYTHPYLINSQIQNLVESLPHHTKTSCEIEIHPKSGLWEPLSERELDQNIVELAQNVREDVRYTILNNINEIKNTSYLVKEVIQIYQSNTWNHFYEWVFKTRSDMPKINHFLSQHKLEFIALIQDLDEREYSTEKREFFEGMGVFFQEFKKTDSHEFKFEGFYKLWTMKGIFEAFPPIRERFLNALEMKKYDEINFMFESIDRLVFIVKYEGEDNNPMVVIWREVRQEEIFQETMKYLHSIITNEQLRELTDNTLLLDLVKKSQRLE